MPRKRATNRTALTGGSQEKRAGVDCSMIVLKRVNLLEAAMIAVSGRMT
jgi:hypothetical protein